MVFDFPKFLRLVSQMFFFNSQNFSVWFLKCFFLFPKFLRLISQINYTSADLVSFAAVFGMSRNAPPKGERCVTSSDSEVV